MIASTGYIRDGWLHRSPVVFLDCRLSRSLISLVCSESPTGSACTDTAVALDQYREICCEQPLSMSLPKLSSTHRHSESRNSHRATQWLVEGRQLASRASSRASFIRPSRRPTIGAPSDFRRVNRPAGRVGGFRPLELSIYLPGNELQSLPIFTEDGNGECGLEYSAQALTKARSDSMLSRPSTSFTIPRKPVASRRTFSLDGSASCSSRESRYTCTEFNAAFGTRSMDRRPSLATSQSTQDFLDTLDARFPQAPPKLRSKSGPEPIYTLYRRASEQSLRLRTHLEEREKIERRLPECDTILEEKHAEEQKFPNLSPISSHGDAADDLQHNNAIRHHHQSSQSTTSPSLAHSQSSSQPSLNLLESKSSDPPTTRSRISQWLLCSASSQSSPSLISSPSSTDGNFPHHLSTARDRASTASSLGSTLSHTVDLATPWTTPRSSPRRKGSSFSLSYASGHCRILSFDDEKTLPVMNVGVAF